MLQHQFFFLKYCAAVKFKNPNSDIIIFKINIYTTIYIPSGDWCCWFNMNVISAASLLMHTHLSRKQHHFCSAESGSVQFNWFSQRREAHRPQLARANSIRSNVILGNLPSRVRAPLFRTAVKPKPLKIGPRLFPPNCFQWKLNNNCNILVPPQLRHLGPIPAKILTPLFFYHTVLISLTKAKTAHWKTVCLPH